MKNMASSISNLKPMWEFLEPYKVAELNLERGVPSLHDAIGK